MASQKIVVIGAGISGLTAAYLLDRKGYDVLVLEKKNEAGGSIESVQEKGFLFDRGPNSVLETTPVIAQFVEELGLQNQLVYANKEANKRYILRDGKLHPLPMNLSGFFKTKLFSPGAKARLIAEPLMGRSKEGYYESVAEFVTRRLGKEFLDYAINPFVSGVYAGKPEKLSIKSAFPKLYELEEKYGGLIFGAIKSIKERKKHTEKLKQSGKMLSFRDGMQVLPNAIADNLEGKVKLLSEVISIEKRNENFKVTYTYAKETESIMCDKVISTVPAYIAANLFGNFDEGISKHFLDIYYPPVLALFFVYNKKDIGRALDGFGFLIPEKEDISFLGAIWNSAIFPNRTDDDKASFTLFMGGACNPEIGSYDKEVITRKVRMEFEPLMKISGEPIYSSHKFWQKAIPQYNLGYIEHERYFDEFERRNRGIILSGNYRGGISVGDCIKNSEVVISKIENLCISAS